jgi:hypothetical protein
VSPTLVTEVTISPKRLKKLRLVQRLISMCLFVYFLASLTVLSGRITILPSPANNVAISYYLIDKLLPNAILPFSYPFYVVYHRAGVY